MMIERHWKGICKRENAERYEEHLKHDTFKKLAHISGFKGAKILTRELNGDIEFLIITIWESLAAIQKFAGEEADVAVVPMLVQNMMVSYDLVAAHYEVH
jgi:heme-degrading monooxygenase HmoA